MATDKVDFVNRKGKFLTASPLAGAISTKLLRQNLFVTDRKRRRASVIDRLDELLNQTTADEFVDKTKLVLCRTESGRVNLVGGVRLARHVRMPPNTFDCLTL